MKIATFAAGCFWGPEERFRTLPGVTSTRVGYTGGTLQNPTYDDVAYRNTGHAEAVEVTYDPKKITYEALLDAFFDEHDPTQVNRQGPNIGDEYRSAIFYHDDAQRVAAEKAKAAVAKSGRYAKPIVTEIVPAATFWQAEEFHQQFLAKRGRSSCHW